jgi:hypothetical protein
MTTKKQQQQEQQAQDMIAQCYQDGKMTINGRDYEFAKFNHGERVQVFSYYSRIQHLLPVGNYSFLTDEEYKRIEKMVSDKILFNGVQLSKQPTHWETYPEDYLQFAVACLGVISYPFFHASPTA